MNLFQGPPDDSLKRHDMVRWYSPLLLIRMGFRAATAAVFGLYADKRELQAALNPLDDENLCGEYDYSGDPSAEFWFDYVADLGDGWNATNGVARQLARETLPARGKDLPRGRLLIMGGDQVYPDPSRDAYREKLVEPYRAALPDGAGQSPDLYAIPGNHDWYDGLNTFSALFCRRTRGPAAREGRKIGAWQTQQTRSYFALKFPQGWWLWGIDDQLNGYIDSEQIEYFARVAEECMTAGDKVILCAAAPAWVYAKTRRPDACQNLAYLEGILARNKVALRVALTGDLHHYNRYRSGDGATQLITAGGGGAFLHPAHMLPERVEIGWRDRAAESFDLASRYPDRGTSLRLTARNLLLPLLNLDFAAAIGVVYALLAWILQSRSILAEQSLAELLLHGSYLDAVNRFLATLARSPEFAAIVAVMLVILVRFSDCRRSETKLLLGGLHWGAHLAALIGLFCAAVEINARVFGLPPANVWFMPLLLLEMIAAGGLLGGFLFGVYLLGSLNLLRRHWTEASSSLRIQDYKNFLRLHIDREGILTVYPFKLDRVPRWRKWREVLPPSAPELIEDPIVIR